ncbi:hypothetical protein HY477_04055 [Candidatus Uhrbacteria bacterium]|nr:hypothetical protein [Candidatus Uhrbacteria bacterium]
MPIALQHFKRFAPIILLLSTFYFLFSLQPTHAQIPLSPLQPELQEEILGVTRSAAGLGVPALEEVDIRVYAMRLVKGALLFIGLIVIILVMYGGFMYMTAAGNEEKISKAVQIITRAAIGTGIVLASYAIVFFVSRTLQRTIFQNLNRQVQNCSTQGGVATCCQEFAAFQNAGSISYTSGELAEQARRNREIQQQRYEEWQECVDRSNPF